MLVRRTQIIASGLIGDASCEWRADCGARRAADIGWIAPSAEAASRGRKIPAHA